MKLAWFEIDRDGTPMALCVPAKSASQLADLLVIEEAVCLGFSWRPIPKQRQSRVETANDLVITKAFITARSAALDRSACYNSATNDRKSIISRKRKRRCW